MNRRQFLPEGPQGIILESRQLLSAASTAMVSVPAKPHTITGGAKGSFTAKLSFADAPTLYTLEGSGKAAHMGKAKFSASLYSVGFVVTGHATGTATITTKSGKLKITLVGPRQTGFSPLPSHFDFTITGGTKQFAHAKGSGTLDLNLATIDSNNVLVSKGTFSLHYLASID